MLRFLAGVSLRGGLLAAVSGCAGPLAKAEPPAVTLARRIVLGPTSVAVVDEAASLGPGELPAWVTLGRAGATSRALLMRFEVPVEAVVDTAYLVIDRASEGASDGAGVSLHAERIVEAWGSTVTWQRQPSLGGASPSLAIDPRKSGPLRIDVTSFYRPTSHDPVSHDPGPRDEGLALLADNSTPRGVAIAVVARGAAPAEASPETGPRAPHAPRLELYVR